ncbi:DUF2252 domain-containing protein [Actinocorallia lasiicapitis]
MTGTPRDEYKAGKALRKRVPRSSQAQWDPPAGRKSPVRILFAQDEQRLPDLVPLRHERMAASPFAFLRGSAAVMASDLSGTPSTGLTVQACGDSHLMNFGLYASPERSLIFDVNDFDETLPGPWEWDLKRLAASLVVAARDLGHDDTFAHKLARGATASYRERVHELSEMPNLDVYYALTNAEDILSEIKKHGMRERAEHLLAHARSRDNLQATEKLTQNVDGRLEIVDQPPLLLRDTSADSEDLVKHSLAEYSRSLREDVAALLGEYRYMDAGRKVVGVGSVGTRCFIVVLQGRDAHDPLVLQIKQATRSVLEPYLAPSVYRNQGRRVVAGQRSLQTVSDIFLGWSADGPNQYYWRQLRDMKGSIDLNKLKPAGLRLYAKLCARALAVGHATTGPRIRLAGYLGHSSGFDEAIAEFALAYADQTLKDHAAFAAAIS